MIEGMCWNERIAAAEKRGSFTDDDEYKAGGWSNCAVGEKFMWFDSKKTKRGLAEDNMHGYSLAGELGGLFAGAVKSDCVKTAKAIYARVQKCTKAELTEKMNPSQEKEVKKLDDMYYAEREERFNPNAEMEDEQAA